MQKNLTRAVPELQTSSKGANKTDLNWYGDKDGCLPTPHYFFPGNNTGNGSNKANPDQNMQDDMQNSWGCALVQISSRYPSIIQSRFEAVVKKAVLGFQLNCMQISGTTANEKAVDLATDGNISTCLFAMGSYIGGEGKLYNFSTSEHASNKLLSVPSLPVQKEDRWKRQIVALPYHVPCPKVTAGCMLKYEKHCLDALNRKLLRALIAGTPYTTILMELILCGSGGELSDTFLKALGSLLSEYNVSIIVDEVMTGGRVGPNMAMTETAPTEFQKQVAYITMGKMTNCGLVLERIAGKPTEKESLRGFSTAMTCGEAWTRWNEVVTRVQAGVINRRRQDVLTSMATTEKDSWGRGCLIFTPRRRENVTQSLKNRLLPMLEQGKIAPGKTVASKWNRSSVCECLMDAGYKWTKAMASVDEDRNPFVYGLAGYMLDSDVKDMTALSLMAHVGVRWAEEMTEKERKRRKEKLYARRGSCSMQPESFLTEILGASTVNAGPLVKRVRVGSQRKLVYRLERKHLVEVKNLL